MMTMAQLAAELNVDRRQVYAWYKRRTRNGFPEAAKFEPYGQRTRPYWHLHEVVEWRKSYTPSRGGRPTRKGNLLTSARS